MILKGSETYKITQRVIYSENIFGEFAVEQNRITGRFFFVIKLEDVSGTPYKTEKYRLKIREMSDGFLFESTIRNIIADYKRKYENRRPDVFDALR